MNKKQKTILTSTLTTIAVAVPAITAISIMSIPRNNLPSDTYLLSFKNDPEKQKYLKFLKLQVDEVFKEYKKLHPDFQGLNLEFINLNRTLNQGINNFFTELDKSVKAINENLSFTMLQRNPITLERGFRQLNVDMVSMFWSPDYNDIGTWLTYMFALFQTPNLWPMVASAINFPDQYQEYNKTGWIQSLTDHLRASSFTYKSNATKQPVTIKVINDQGKALSNSYILKFVQDGASESSIYTSIGNGLSSWSNQADVQKIGFSNPTAVDFENNKVLYNNSTHLFKDFGGGIEGYTDSKLNEFLNFLNSNNVTIPYVQDGPLSREISLLREGLHIPKNTNSWINQRDWYMTDELKKTHPKPSIPSPTKPFDSSNSALNPTFAKNSIGSSLGSLYTPLFTWSTIGDFYKRPDGTLDDSKFLTEILSYGAAEKVGDENTPDGLIHKLNNVINQPPGQEKVFEINIRPIPWVDYKGNELHDESNNLLYLSPEDYWAGFKGYYNAIETRYTSNDYFANLINIDLEATLNDPLNKQRNTNPNETKPFRIHFADTVDLLASNIIDVLTAQYFCALPAFEPKVKNITDDAKFKDITGVDLSLPPKDRKPLNQTPEIMSQLYGCGDSKKLFTEARFTSPYLLSKVTDQTYEFTINRKAFDTFQQLAANSTFDKPIDNYSSFKYNDVINNQPISKLDVIEFKYTEETNAQVQFELFRTNQIDSTPIPPSEKSQILGSEQYKKNIYEVATLKVNQSNLIPYNIEVFNKDSAGNIYFEDGTHPNFDQIQNDKYGNIIFKDKVPRVKDKITPGYYDLIVKNFFTPIDGTDENGNLLPVLDRSSAIIRTAINDMINWFSLTSIIYNGQSKIMQNSFIPYGVANMKYMKDGAEISNISENRAKYWNLSAYKVGQNSHKGFNRLPDAGQFGNTLGGNIEWTWNELILDWSEKINHKGGGK